MWDWIRHPAVVHLPLALAFLMPFFALVIWWAIRKGLMHRQFWLGLVVLQAILFGSGVLAIKTGEHDEEIIEKVVSENVIEHHEEKGELFVKMSGVLVLVLLLGLWSRYTLIFHALSVLFLLLNMFFAIRLGHSGGELVYKYGAASAHMAKPLDHPNLLQTEQDDDDED